MSKNTLIVLGIVLLAIIFAVFIISNKTSGTPSNASSSTGPHKYLIFWLSSSINTSGYSNIPSYLIAKLGTTGTRNRSLGIGVGIPFWTQNESAVSTTINNIFAGAEEYNISILFSIDDNVNWTDMPQLWNWYNASLPGYNPNNRYNVEWYGWNGTPNKHQYITPEGIPIQSPEMCLNSPAVLQSIANIITQDIGPTFKQQLTKLQQENKSYLFAGIELGQEQGIQNYSDVPELANVSQNTPEFLRLASEWMAQDNAPHSTLGYCALTNEGYNSTNPPSNFTGDLESVNQQFIQYVAEEFADSGIPSSKLFTHVAADYGSVNQSGYAPISIAFDPYATPGFTTYPTGQLQNGLGPIYTQVALHGNVSWAGIEGNAYGGASSAPNWGTYLAWQYDHGAVLVGINVGAVGPEGVSATESAFNASAIAAYRRFLYGLPLNGSG